MIAEKYLVEIETSVFDVEEELLEEYDDEDEDVDGLPDVYNSQEAPIVEDV